MGGRLSILACMREVAERLERWGVSGEYLFDWSERVTKAVCQPVASVEQMRMMEDRVSMLIRQAFDEVERVAHESAK